MRIAIALAGLVAIGGGLLSQSAAAEPPCGRGWRKHEACGGYVYPPQVYVTPGPVYVVPAPMYVQRPPVVVVAPYPVYAPPSLSIGVTIPLR